MDTNATQRLGSVLGHLSTTGGATAAPVAAAAEVRSASFATPLLLTLARVPLRCD